jgi:hypothetical protein
MSFREKSAWISFVSILLVFGAYFWNVSRLLAGRVAYRAAFNVEVGLLVAFVVLEIVLHVAVAMQAPNEARAPKDETMHVTRSVWAMGQHVILAVVVAELVKFGGQILYFRRGV